MHLEVHVAFDIIEDVSGDLKSAGDYQICMNGYFLYLTVQCICDTTEKVHKTACILSYQLKIQNDGFSVSGSDFKESEATKDLIKKLISDVKASGGTTSTPSLEMKNLLCEFLELESSLGNKPDNSFFNWKGTRDFGNIVTYRTHQRTIFKKYRKNTHALYASLD